MRAPHPGRHSGRHSNSCPSWTMSIYQVGRFGLFLDVYLVVLLPTSLHALSFFHPSTLCPSSISSYVVLPPFPYNLSFRSSFKSALMFENMIMIKRTPKLVHLNGPAMPAPPGMYSNFVNPSNLKTEGLVVVTFCLILSTLVVGMRMWTKSRVVRKIVLEDCKSTLFRSSLLLFAY